MSGKDYILFAQHIRRMDEGKLKEEVIDLCCKVFKIDNGRFKEEMFRDYCKAGWD